MKKDYLKEKGIDSYTLFEWHWLEDMTFKQIADRLGCAVGTVFNLFCEYGILRKQSFKGKVVSEETKKKLSEKRKGRVFSAETREKMSKSARKRFSGGVHPAWWKGGVKHREDGYTAIWMPDHPFSNDDGYIMEHRLVMERHIGRYLTKEEVVHHKNGVRNDNRIENLHLFANGGEHQRYHALNTRKRNERGFFKNG